MGLDMFLYAERYLSGPQREFGDEVKGNAAALAELAGLPMAGGATGIYVKSQLAYWRKANAIHQWFVQNVQGGEDECKPHYVSRAQLKTLRDICQKVLDDPSLAEEYLSPADGFFFGSTEMDEYYFKDLRSTISQIDFALMAAPEDSSFIYEASW